MIRAYSTKTNFFKLFPKATSANPFVVDTRKLRKEYRALQQVYHPDRSQDINTTTTNTTTTNTDIDSQLLNKAYTTLKAPLLRAQYILQLNGVDVSHEALKTSDSVFLMEILEVHDELENASTKEEVDSLHKDNEYKIQQIEQKLVDLFSKQDYQAAKELVIRLKYYTNIQHALSSWEPGKPITLSH